MTLLERMLNELKTNEGTVVRANSLNRMKMFDFGGDITFGVPGMGYNFDNAPDIIKIGFIQTLLSKGVMEFLDVPNKEYQENYTIYTDRKPTVDLRSMIQGGHKTVYGVHETNKHELSEYQPPQTLDHLLHTKFTNALYVGKTLEQAIQIIEDIYINNI
jgi:hypothetical protein